MEPFVSSIPVAGGFADTIVVTCSDGRLRLQTAQFLEHLGVQADFYVIPGGPLIFVREVETFLDSSIAVRRLKFLATEHGTKRIILITHGSSEEPHQCGMANVLFRSVSVEDRARKQKSAVLDAARHLAGELGVQVDCLYANVVGDSVRFEEITG